MQIESPHCDKCKSNAFVVFTETPNLTHYGRWDCKQCDRWIKFQPKPINEIVRRETTKVNNLDRSYCQLCGRKKDMLGTRETIVPHHLIPLEEGGKDARENLLMICSPCHMQVHWLRRYLNHHQQRFYNKEVENASNEITTTTIQVHQSN